MGLVEPSLGDDTAVTCAVCRQMRAQEAIGFEFMPRASDAYYRDLPQKVCIYPYIRIGT